MAKIENILIKTPANFSTMKNGEMVTQIHGDNVFSYLKHNNNVYTLEWKKQSEVVSNPSKSDISSDKYKKQKFGWKIKNNGQSEFETIDARVSINSLNWKFFTGTTASKQLFSTIAHGVPDGKKRILCVSVNIQSDSSPAASSGSIPVNSFIAGAGNLQDEHDEDREYMTLFDDTNVYIFIDSTSDDVQTNRYTCAVFYTDHNLY
mgnify:CR=1 FL=1